MNILSSSSPAFGTPVHPIRNNVIESLVPTILPILLPPATLRPLAFRVFTKKHNLTLTSPALQSLADVIGKHCGSGWRDAGLGEKVLEEAAKAWKRDGGPVIVEGSRFQDILRILETSMSGGRLVRGDLSRTPSVTAQNSLGDGSNSTVQHGPVSLLRDDSQTSIGFSSLTVDEEDENQLTDDPLHYMKVIGAFEQPQLKYVASKKHFEKVTATPSLLPDPSHKTQLFRHRYNLIHQRLLRNESFHAPAVSITRNTSLQRSSSTGMIAQQAYKITPIANLLGRSGTNHLLLGLLNISPTGTLAITDLTASIALDLRHARPIPEDGAWFSPGMMALVDGIYEEGSGAEATLRGGGGVGGTISGRFVGTSIGGPPCEKREITLGVNLANGGAGEVSAGGGFGWVDFLGVGSERGAGPKMRKVERNLLKRSMDRNAGSSRTRAIIIGEIHLDDAKSVQALKTVFAMYANGQPDEMPMTFILVGSFIRHAVMGGGANGDSIEYKECLDTLASVLSEFSPILQASTFIFVPGDNDPWASAFSAGAASVIPRREIPDVFTSRIKRAFASANSEAVKLRGASVSREAIWTSNPSRITLFGPVHEIVIFRDDISGRLHRNAIGFQKSKDAANENDTDNNETHGQNKMESSNGGDHFMNIDNDVVAAESHVPASKRKEAQGSFQASNLSTARKLVKTILDQGFLSPFPLTIRPILWDFAAVLQLYPLPTALVLVDPGAPPFAVTYEGCHVMNPGGLIVEGQKGVARWMEYDISTRKSRSREMSF